MEKRADVSLFGVETVTQYLTICSHAVTELREDQGSVLRGFTAILALNHIPDWLRYKLSSDERNVLELERTVHTPVRDVFESRSSDLSVIRDLANGFKHLRPIDPTGRIEGYGNGPFGVGPFGIPYLLVDLGEALEGAARWIDCHSLCERVLVWWCSQLAPTMGGFVEGDE